MATKRADLRATLSLDGSKFAKGLSSALGQAKDFSAKMAGGMTSRLGEGLKSAGRKAIAVGTAGMMAAAAGLGMSIYKAMDMETVETQFSTLLGGMANAQKRVADLQKFADTTPFAMPEVAQSSRVLEVLTKGALSTGKGLRMVGDVAAGVGNDFSDTAIWVGRLYDALQNSRPAGEALMRLSELGAMASDTRDKIEKLQASGKGNEAWNVATQAFGRFGGGMDALSNTFSGKMSTLGDTINGIFRELGRPIMDALKPVLDMAISLGNSLQKTAKEFGNAISGGLKMGLEMLKNGDLWEYIQARLSLGMAVAGNHLLGLVESAIKLLTEGVRIAFTSGAAGLFQLMTGAGLALGSALLKGLEPVLSKLMNSLGIDNKSIFGQNKILETATTMEQAGSNLITTGAGNIGKSIQDGLNSLQNVAQAYKPSTAFSPQADVAAGLVGLYEDKAKAALSRQLFSDAMKKSTAAPGVAASMTRNGVTQNFVAGSSSSTATMSRVSQGGSMTKDGVTTYFKSPDAEKKQDASNELLKGVQKLLEDIKLTMSQRALA